eukprot:247716_1
MSSVEEVDVKWNWDEECIESVKSFSADVKRIIMDLIFANGTCIDCKISVTRYGYFCYDCATKRLQVICGTQMASFRIDQHNKWGIHFFSRKKSLQANSSMVYYKIYHLLSGKLIYETESKTVGGTYYGNFSFSFHNMKALGPYQTDLTHKQQVLCYIKYDGSPQFGTQCELDLYELPIYQRILDAGGEIYTL